jgi:hypothetical protein
MTTKEPVTYFTFHEKTAFIPLRFVYPECMVLIKEHPQMFPLKCFMEDGCPANANCGEIIVRRVHYLFQEVIPQSDVIICYYKYPDRPKSIRGAVFNRDLQPPEVSVLNPYAFRKFMKGGITYQWFPSDEFLFMGGSDGLIPVEGLIKV